jgi:predicted RNA-binding Zn ribbon-like protein
VSLQAEAFDDIERAELLFHFGAGAVSLDFVATVGERWRRGFERLRTPPDLASWLTAVGLLKHGVEASEEALVEARRLRSAIFDCVEARRAGRPPPPSALRTVNRCAAAPDPAPRLTPRWSCDRVSDVSVSAALSAVARDAIELLSMTESSRIRECAATDCSRLFVDRSRPGSRRWCESSGCGNRANTSAYRRRLRSAVGRKSAD